jgi:hypothetical protein
MAKESGLGARFVVDTYDISADTRTLNSIDFQLPVIDMTSIDKLAYERQIGVKGAKLSATLFFNPTAATGTHVLISTLPRTNRQMTYMHRSTIGAPAYSMRAKQINYDPSRTEEGALLVKLDAESDGTAGQWGTMLTDGVVTSTGAQSYAGTQDIVGTTNFGLQMWVHLLAFSGTSVTVNIQGSTDNGGGDAFTTITGATTGALTTPGVSYVATAGNVAVEQWLRCNLTGTYSSATLAVIAVRNEVATVY